MYKKSRINQFFCKEKLLSAVNQLVPKKNIILFTSFPPFCDNSWALYQYMQEHREDICKAYQLMWAQEAADIKAQDRDEIHCKIIDKKSVKGIWTFLRAKYVISTHGYFSGVKSGAGQVQLNLWHGCGYKAAPPEEKIFRGDINIVTSPLYQASSASIFKIPKEKVWITGYPRNDKLFEKTGALAKLGIRKEETKKVYVWLPTYRKADTGHDGVDGRADSFGAGSITLEEYRRLDGLLAEKKYSLLIKPHPMDAMAAVRTQGMKNIFSYTSRELKERKVDLYELLGEADGLLSDYSSAVIDFTLRMKPVVMVLSDLEEYHNSRGFCLEPVTDYFPGPVISDFEGLYEYFGKDDGVNSKWEKKVRQLRSRFHLYGDRHSSKRVCDAMWGKGYRRIK